MVEYNQATELSDIFKALSDATRRALLTQLAQQGPTRVTDLANYYDISLNAISKHIKVLEHVGLVKRRTAGRVHWIEANLSPLSRIDEWNGQLRSIWSVTLDKLERLLANKES